MACGADPVRHWIPPSRELHGRFHGRHFISCCHAPQNWAAAGHICLEIWLINGQVPASNGIPEGAGGADCSRWYWLVWEVPWWAAGPGVTQKVPCLQSKSMGWDQKGQNHKGGIIGPLGDTSLLNRSFRNWGKYQKKLPVSSHFPVVVVEMNCAILESWGWKYKTRSRC